MIGPSSLKNPLTVDDLHKNALGFDIGYWPITTKSGRRKNEYLIVKDNRGYVLAKARPLTIVGSAPTLPAIIQSFNERLAIDEVVIK